MKKLKSILILFGLILTITMTSCTTTRVATLTKGDNETIELFTTKLPDKKYVEICYIETSGGIFHTPQQLLNGLKKKAIEIKADALLITGCRLCVCCVQINQNINLNTKNYRL
jgi:hypothetical protein